MLKSMTGFGHGECEQNQKKIIIDIRSVNGKFLDQTVKMPKSLMSLEDLIRKNVASRLSRGSVEIYVSYIDYQNNEEDVIINTPLAKELLLGSNKIAEDLNLDNNLTVRDLMRFNDVVQIEKAELNIDELRPILINALNDTLNSIDEMRIIEGKNLYIDLKEKINNIEINMNKIEKIAPTVEIEYAEKLKQRVSEILGGVQIDEAKLANEVAFFADKADINEEIVRMKSHIKQFNEILDSNEPAGKKFEFLCQEMTRETNTLGSKANNLNLTNLVLYQKNELEKIKEQMRNVE